MLIFATALIAYMENHQEGFTGTVKQLLEELEAFKPDLLGESWIRSCRDLGDALHRLGPTLRLNGIEVKAEEKPCMHGFYASIRRIEEDPELVHELHEHYERFPQTYAQLVDGEYW